MRGVQKDHARYKTSMSNLFYQKKTKQIDLVASTHLPTTGVPDFLFMRPQGARWGKPKNAQKAIEQAKTPREGREQNRRGGGGDFFLVMSPDG
jgi:hypothetical protein